MEKIKIFLLTLLRILVLSAALFVILLFIPENSSDLEKFGKYEVVDYIDYNREILDKEKDNICAALSELHKAAGKTINRPVNFEYLQDSIVPCLFCVNRYLTPAELTGTALYIECIGADSFGGETSCAFIDSLNAEKNAEICARTMASFPAGKGMEEKAGMLWLGGAVFLNKIQPENLPLRQLSETSFHKLYRLSPDSIYVPKFESRIISELLNN